MLSSNARRLMWGIARAKLDRVTPVRPRHHVVDAEVVFGAQVVALRGPAREIATYADPRRLEHIRVEY